MDDPETSFAFLPSSFVIRHSELPWDKLPSKEWQASDSGRGRVFGRCARRPRSAKPLTRNAAALARDVRNETVIDEHPHTHRAGLARRRALRAPATATKRRFTIFLRPETLPKGAMEFEQWITLRTRARPIRRFYQENYNRWDFRSELEYGVTDRYTVGLYLNAKNERFP
jgi:hypothetical protein